MDRTPPEILSRITKWSVPAAFAYDEPLPNRHACVRYSSLATVCAYWRDVVRPLLYFCPHVRSHTGTAALLVRTVEEHPELGEMVRGLHFEMWAQPGEGEREREKRARGELLRLLNACPNLEHLQLQLGIVDFPQLLRAAPNLRYLYTSFTNFTSFTTSSDMPISHDLVLLHIHGGSEFPNGAPQITFPHLRHLAYRAVTYKRFDPFCNTLEHVANLEVSIPTLTPEMGKLLATVSRLDNLAIDARDYTNLNLAHAPILKCFSAISISSLTLRHFGGIIQVWNVFKRTEPMIRSIKSLRVCPENQLSTADDPKGYDREVTKLEAFCETQGLEFLGVLYDSYRGFWELVAPHSRFIFVI